MIWVNKIMASAYLVKTLFWDLHTSLLALCLCIKATATWINIKHEYFLTNPSEVIRQRTTSKNMVSVMQLSGSWVQCQTSHLHLTQPPPPGPNVPVNLKNTPDLQGQSSHIYSCSNKISSADIRDLSPCVNISAERKPRQCKIKAWMYSSTKHHYNMHAVTPLLHHCSKFY